jgi:hypothetical protein
MFRDMHLTRNKQLGRLHERLSRELNRQHMDDNNRRLEALKANDFEAYKELLKQMYGPSTDDDRFAGAWESICICQRDEGLQDREGLQRRAVQLLAGGPEGCRANIVAGRC